MPFPGLVYLVYFVIYAGLWIGGFVLLLAGRGLKKTWLKIVGSILLSAALYITASYLWGEHEDNSPGYVYESVFEEKPSSKIALVSGKISDGPDSVDIALRFTTDRDSFDRLRGQFQTRFEIDLNRVSVEQFWDKRVHSYGESIDPEFATLDTDIYMTNTDTWPTTPVKYAEVSYNTKTGLVQLHYIGN